LPVSFQGKSNKRDAIFVISYPSNIKTQRMDNATITMIENLHKNTGKSLAQWIDIVEAQNFEKHGEVIKFLKETHGLTHGFANMIAHKAKGSDAGSSDNPADLITKQYQGKEHFMPLYDKLISEIKRFGDDFAIAPKIAYVSLRRKKQFATLQAATKTRFEIGINLKGQEPKGKLEAEKPNSMCSHKIKIADIREIDEEVLSWIKAAYDNAG
jgi:predicted transport protein